MTWFLLTLGSACGGVRVEHDMIVEAAPIFYRLLGKPLPKNYNVVKLEDTPNVPPTPHS